MKIAQLIVSVSLAGALLACGQKGPLVMPDAQKHKRTIPLPPASAKPSSGSAAPAAPASGSPSSPAPDSTSHP